MKTFDWILPLRNRRVPSNFYLKSPFRDGVFLGNSFVLLADILLVTIILVKHWDRLPPQTIFCLGIAVFGLLSMWRWALRSHREVSLLLKAGKIEKPEAGSTVGYALGVAANMTYLGLFYAFLLVGICFGALGELFIRRH